jgi:cytochrome c peroxidase
LPTFFESLFPPHEAEILRLSRGDRDLGPGDRLQELLDFRQRPTRSRGELKAPMLRGMHEQVLLFHDGRFEHIEEAVAYMNERLELSLTRDELAAIVEYVRGL